VCSERRNGLQYSKGIVPLQPRFLRNANICPDCIFLRKTEARRRVEVVLPNKIFTQCVHSWPEANVDAVAKLSFRPSKRKFLLFPVVFGSFVLQLRSFLIPMFPSVPAFYNTAFRTGPKVKCHRPYKRNSLFCTAFKMTTEPSINGKKTYTRWQAKI
jgi:hypothetical protein